MSKLWNSKDSEESAPLNSWRVRDTPGRDKWPISRWFQKYHLNYRTEQWLSKETRKVKDENGMSPSKETTKLTEAWRLIQKERNSPNSNSVLKRNHSNRINETNIATPYDIVHRIQELKKPKTDFDEFYFSEGEEGHSASLNASKKS